MFGKKHTIGGYTKPKVGDSFIVEMDVDENHTTISFMMNTRLEGEGKRNVSLFGPIVSFPGKDGKIMV